MLGMKRSKSKKAENMRGPRPNATRYNGPSRVNWGKDDEVMHTMVATQAVEITTVAGTGTYNFVVSTNDVLSQADHILLASLYEEFRVLAIETRFIPKIQGADPSAAGGGSGTEQLTPFVIAPWREDGTALTTFQLAASVGGSKVGPANWNLRKVLRADEPDQMLFSDTASVSLSTENLWGTKQFLFIASGPAAATVEFGFLVVYFTCQYRTRRSLESMLARNVAKPSEEKSVSPGIVVQPQHQQAASVDSSQARWLVIQESETDGPSGPVRLAAVAASAGKRR